MTTLLFVFYLKETSKRKKAIYEIDHTSNCAVLDFFDPKLLICLSAYALNAYELVFDKGDRTGMRMC